LVGYYREEVGDSVELLGLALSARKNLCIHPEVGQRSNSLKTCTFLVKIVNRSTYNVMTIRKMLISYIKLDHTLYSVSTIYVYMDGCKVCDLTYSSLSR
jgi:hypothetical protein